MATMLWYEALVGIVTLILPAAVKDLGRHMDAWPGIGPRYDPFSLMSVAPMPLLSSFVCDGMQRART